MAEGCCGKYGTLCVRVADGSNTLQDAQSLQIINDMENLESKLETILSLLDPSSSDTFTEEVKINGLLLLGRE